jgi:hypothetical protein
MTPDLEPLSLSSTVFYSNPQQFEPGHFLLFDQLLSFFFFDPPLFTPETPKEPISCIPTGGEILGRRPEVFDVRFQGVSNRDKKDMEYCAVLSGSCVCFETQSSNF